MLESFQCTPRQVRGFMRDILFAGLVPFVQSSPGMGKSAITKSIADELNLKLIDHRLSTSAPEDLSGLPEFYTNEQGERRARFVPFGDLFPLEGDPLPAGKDGWLLFLDEMNSASKPVQAASYKLILDKMTGQRHLHSNVAMVAAGNLSTDRAITTNLSTAMQSRVVHLEMRVSFDEWLMDVALKEGYDSRIVAFLSQFPSKLMDFKPDHNDKTFCCPRTWEFVERMINGKPVTDASSLLLAGTITQGVAVDFVQFCQIYANLITIDRIVADPENCPLPNEQSMRWATITHMMEKVTEQNFEKVSQYADRFTMDFRILFYRSVLIRQPKLRSHSAFINALASLGRYLAG